MNSSQQSDLYQKFARAEYVTIDFAKCCFMFRSLRLSNTNLLSAPFVRTSFGSRSFSVAAPKIWNSPSISPYLYQ